MKRFLPRIRMFPASKNAGLFLLTAVMLAASCVLTLQFKHRTDHPPTSPGTGPRAGNGPLDYERIGNPARTVARDRHGTIIATFTDGARTAVLDGPSRTFAEPRTTDAKVVTKSWVRVLPKAWARGAERTDWFQSWFKTWRSSREPDVLAWALEYVAGAPPRWNKSGLRYSGDARYGPRIISDSGRPLRGKRRMGSDFYDYLGVPWRFPDGVTRRPQEKRHHSVDCSGYVRLVFGYRAGLPLNSRNSATGNGLQRTADGIAHGPLGVPVIPLTDRRPDTIQGLQPGDLVFFRTRKLPDGRIGHVGLYLGLDTDDHPRFISSRKTANGPTMGDKGGTSRLDGEGYYARGLRGARRL
jgi:hypothetical protein